MPDDEAILDMIRRLPGVVRAELLSAADRTVLRELFTPASAHNRGVEEVLSREVAFCLFKAPEFRPPPEPTLLLMDEAGNVLGREIVPGRAAPEGRRFAYLGKDFILYGDVRPEGRLQFSLPPVRFPELDRVPGIEWAVSASPDTPQDDYLKDRFGVARGNTLASILVGYDRRNS